MKQEALTRRLATTSLLLATGPLVLAAAAGVHYLRRPPPLSGFEGVGWFFGMVALLSLLVIVTHSLAPISIACGLWALARLRLPHAQGAPPTRAGRRRAAAGAAVSALALAAVATGQVLHRRAEARAEAAERPRLEEMARRRAPEERAERLVQACHDYAFYDDGDRFPGDIHELRLWCGRNGRWTEELGSDEFAYVGAGADDVTRRKLTAEEIGQVGRLLLFVQREPSPDGSRVLGFAGSSPYGGGGGARTVPDRDLETYLRLSNDERRRRGLPPVDFGQVGLAAPASTQPVPGTP